MGRRRRVLASCALLACGARTTLDVTIRRDPASTRRDAAATSRCPPSTVVGDVYGAPRFFGDGGSVAPGAYRVTYVDGCMKYSDAGTWGDMGWTVNAYPDGAAPAKDWWLVAGSPDHPLLKLPGTTGFLLDGGAFASFDACVAANRALEPADFTFDGGRLGVWLFDDPYGDNVPGVDGRSPTWEFECR